MKRRLLQLCFAFGLLLTLTTGALWVRACFATDLFVVERGRLPYEGAVLRLDAHRMAFRAAWMRQRYGSAPASAESRGWRLKHRRDDLIHYAWIRPGAGPWRERLGFGFVYWSGPRAGPMAVHEIGFGAPWWFLFACSAALTAMPYGVLRRTRRLCLRRQEQSLCPTCGYDLRGAEHERCPECGQTTSMASV